MTEVDQLTILEEEIRRLMYQAETRSREVGADEESTEYQREVCAGILSGYQDTWQEISSKLKTLIEAQPTELIKCP